MKKYIYQLKWYMIGRLACHIVYSISVGGIPYIIKLLIDFNFSMDGLLAMKLTGTYLALILVGMLMQYLLQIIGWHTDKKMFYLIRKDAFQNVLKLEYGQFSKKEKGSYISSLTNDVNVIGEYMDYLIRICEDIIGIAVYAYYLFRLNTVIASIMIVITLLTLKLPKLTGKELSNRRKQLLYHTGIYSDKIEDLLGGFSLISKKTLRHIAEEYEKNLIHMENSRLYYGKYRAFTVVFNGLVIYFVDLASFICCAVLLVLKKITVGTASAELSYIKEFTYPVRDMIDCISEIHSTKKVKEQFFEVYKATEEKPVLQEIKKEITFSDVSVHVGDFAMEEINFHWKKNGKYGIIGANGSGKSTLFRLLMGYCKRTSGAIKIDEYDIDEWDIRGAVYYMNQHEHIYHGDFYENTTVYGAYDREKAEQAIKYLDCEKLEIIRQERDCTLLSGGEKQLLCLVRMLASDRPIFLMDEPFSAMDREIAEHVRKKILGIKEKTIIMITHQTREEELELFDSVMVMGKGMTK